MIKAQDILTGLHAIANNYKSYAIIWHVIFYVFIIALIARWVPSNKLIAALTCIPIISVALFAWITGNPFNGIMFSVLAILILIFGLKASIQPINQSQLPFFIIGILMIAFGLLYPHFIETNSIVKYSYASPVGLIPCPTLSILIGFILLYNGFGSKSITLLFISFGLFYGFFGVLKLNVKLDIILILGTLALLTKYITDKI
jgi:hypothetical protein